MLLVSPRTSCKGRLYTGFSKTWFENDQFSSNLILHLNSDAHTKEVKKRLTFCFCFPIFPDISAKTIDLYAKGKGQKWKN